MHHSFVIAAAAFLLAACQSTSQVEATSISAPVSAISALTGDAKAGHDLSEALCSGCHAIRIGEISPNPNSPTFEMIANANGLTLGTLSEFLRNSHNFPENMNFEVVEEDGDALAAYIVTLRSENYTPPIQ